MLLSFSLSQADLEALTAIRELHTTVCWHKDTAEFALVCSWVRRLRFAKPSRRLRRFAIRNSQFASFDFR